MNTYTIDATEYGSQGWRYRVYTEGGSKLIELGGADSLEAALSEATRLILVHHRTGQPERKS